MIEKKPLRTAVLAAREAGLSLLREGLDGNAKVNIASVFTHGSLPKAEGGGPRPELEAYKAFCADRDIPLTVLDAPEAKQIEVYFPENLDLLVAVSWRFLLSSKALRLPKLGALNLHRGALPEYAGAEPVRRAIEAGETHAAITAHMMTEEIDAGPEIARVWLEMKKPGDNCSSGEHAEVVKKRLLALYGPLARLAIDSLAA